MNIWLKSVSKASGMSSNVSVYVYSKNVLGETEVLGVRSAFYFSILPPSVQGFTEAKLIAKDSFFSEWLLGKRYQPFSHQLKETFGDCWFMMACCSLTTGCPVLCCPALSCPPPADVLLGPGGAVRGGGTRPRAAGAPGHRRAEEPAAEGAHAQGQALPEERSQGCAQG